MRRRAAALWLLAAACSVPLEGAPCGDNTNCPSGQACGFDRTCSEAAAACQDIECRQGDASCPSQSVATVCAALGVCGSWQTANCTAAQICGTGGCQARYTLQMTSPGAGVTVGTSGAPVEVSLTPGPTVASPAEITLVAASSGTTITSPLTRTTGSGVSPALYSGTYVPLPNLEEPVTLQAFAAYGQPDETGSNVVAVAADTRPPQIAAVTLSCVTCRRDDTLTVLATIADPHLAAVTATVEFPAGWSQPVSLALVGGDWRGTLALAGQAFPFYKASGRALVRATDSLGNQATQYSSDQEVTRLRFTIPVETSSPPVLTGPAVGPGATLYLGASNGKVYKVEPVTEVVRGWTVATGAIVAAPSLGAALWVGSQDLRVYGVDPTDGTPIGSCTTLGQVLASPAVDTMAPETVYVGVVVGPAPSSGRVYAVRATGCAANTTLYTSQKVAGAAAIDSQKRVYAVTGSTLRSLTLITEPTLDFSENWTTGVGPVEVSVGLDPVRSPGYAWTAATDGSLTATTFAGVAGSPVATAAGPEAAVIDVSGNIVVGDAAGFVHKVVPGGTGWTTSSSLGGAALSALVLTGGDAAYLVPTASGRLAALTSDGSVLWSGQVTPAVGTSLHDPNIVLLQPGDPFWTAVFGAQDGTVYGVLVDGHLDTTAPWPKAHHDTRNTGNAAAPLP